jgi:hypothetical protein
MSGEFARRLQQKDFSAQCDDWLAEEGRFELAVRFSKKTFEMSEEFRVMVSKMAT